jgi:hypothetical protein
MLSTLIFFVQTVARTRPRPVELAHSRGGRVTAGSDSESSTVTHSVVGALERRPTCDTVATYPL